MIICSDNHNVKKYALKENCWIKADKTFEGLKQVIFEPKQRVRIQALKPHQKAGYQVIESVKISHTNFNSQTIYFNQNLSSIIGGRSTGKSILLGAIAKKLNCDKDVKAENEEMAKPFADSKSLPDESVDVLAPKSLPNADNQKLEGKVEKPEPSTSKSQAIWVSSQDNDTLEFLFCCIGFFVLYGSICFYQSQCICFYIYQAERARS